MINGSTFWKIGHRYTGYKLRMSRNLGIRKFKAFYGVSPEICELVWDKLTDARPRCSQPKHLLWCLSFLKQYNSEHFNSAIFKADEKTFRKWVWCFVELLSDMDVIDWENRFDDSVLGQTCFVSLDGVDFRILEPTPFSSKWFSHKFRSAGLRYEIGLCIRTGKIVWYNGGYPCGTYPDLLLARQAYVNIVDEGELTMADKGYNDKKYFLLPNQSNCATHKYIMSRHETVNKRLRQFKILYVPFRHSLEKHTSCFNAVINITELVIENGEPLFSVL